MKSKKNRLPHQPSPPGPAAVKSPATDAGFFRHRLFWLALVCLAIIGLWMWVSVPADVDPFATSPQKDYYNLLVQGFSDGQLNLKTHVSPYVTNLADPFDPKAELNSRWEDGHRLLDLSYYQGKFYLYFGVTPAVVLFWPYAALTGQYLSNKGAMLCFCAGGFLAGAWLLYALWRRCFAPVRFGVLLAGVAALGLASGLPMLLAKCDVYEVAVSCGWMFVMLSLLAVWNALVGPRKQNFWLAAASLAYGLALGARPNLLFGAVILLAPVVMAWRRREPLAGRLLAAAGPILLVGAGLLLYNQLRFGSPLEFGQRYQLGARHEMIQHFSPRYLGYNFLLYFLEPVRWSLAFPFVKGLPAAAMPAGHGAVEFAFGVLTGVPLVWLGLAAPLAWRRAPEAERPALRGLLAAVAAVFATSALLLCVYYWVADRYEVEFLPALVLLGVVGIFSLEAYCPPRWQKAARRGWVVLLAWSVAFNLAHAFERRALAYNTCGSSLDTKGQTANAVRYYQLAMRYKPDYPDPHFNLGCILFERGDQDGAISEFQEALRLKPDYSEARHNLEVAQKNKGPVEEAIRAFQQAVLLKPGDAEPYFNLGNAYVRARRGGDAIAQFQEAVRLRPAYAEAHHNLGNLLLMQGRLDEAIAAYQQAVNLRPDDAEGHLNLGVLFARTDRLDDAIAQFQEALRLKPGYPAAQTNLAQALDLKNNPPQKP